MRACTITDLYDGIQASRAEIIYRNDVANTDFPPQKKNIPNNLPRKLKKAIFRAKKN